MKETIRFILREVVKDLFSIRTEDIPLFSVEIPKNRKFGDLATNLAIVLSGKLGEKLFPLAERITKRIKDFDREKIFSQVEAVKNGFVNFHISLDYLQKNLFKVIKEDKRYGLSDYGDKKKVLIEFVSANPTGPLHIGHGRWAVFGDAIASLLSAVGYRVEREYYINDVGKQIDLLEASVIARIEGRQVPQDGYGGKYIEEAASSLKKKKDDENFKKLIIEYFLSQHRNTLSKLKVNFDRYFPESSLHEEKIVNAIDKLKELKVTFVEDGALWFKSQALGDDKNRVLIRETGETTYFAADIAYHLDKFERGYELLINVWGTDHHGYVPRLKAALEALKLPVKKLQIIIGQLVTLFRKGEPVRMSKRTGEIITLDEVIDEIGVDATRFFLLMTTVNSHLDFDLELAKEKRLENPVYYIQYACARISSIFEKAKEKGIDVSSLKSASLSELKHPSERELLFKILLFEDKILVSALKKEPHLLIEYAKELSADFHNFYNSCRVLGEDEKVSKARLLLIKSTRIVLKNVLELLKISIPEKM